MNLINSNDIKLFGSYCDRENSFDDKKELVIASSFIKSICDSSYKIKENPFGEYDVDLGVFDLQNNLDMIIALNGDEALLIEKIKQFENGAE